MKVINLSEHNSVLNHYLKEIRSISIQQDKMRFRRNIERIGEVMAIEVSKALDYAPEDVQTPMELTQVNTISDGIVIGSVMRAGLPLHQGFLNMFDHAENAFLSAFRRKNEQGQLEVVSEYMAAPDLNGKTLILVDPMLATGLSLDIVYQALLKNGTPKALHICCVIAAPEGVENLRKAMPEESTLWVACIDRGTNANKYIVPGLGDAGDLCFGNKL
ncbi:MAG: uracil phosphoribosyltransferase [Paludibacteraceae bacterium]|nr:uracil phosphoribosyltransferase [Paludibacteraceae bacterium]